MLVMRQKAAAFAQFPRQENAVLRRCQIQRGGKMTTLAESDLWCAQRRIKQLEDALEKAQAAVNHHEELVAELHEISAIAEGSDEVTITNGSDRMLRIRALLAKIEVAQQ